MLSLSQWPLKARNVIIKNNRNASLKYPCNFLIPFVNTITPCFGAVSKYFIH